MCIATLQKTQHIYFEKLNIEKMGVLHWNTASERCRNIRVSTQWYFPAIQNHWTRKSIHSRPTNGTHKSNFYSINGVYAEFEDIRKNPVVYFQTSLSSSLCRVKLCSRSIEHLRVTPGTSDQGYKEIFRVASGPIVCPLSQSC